MPGEQGERWPPVYDLEDLVRDIKTLVDHPHIQNDFYLWRRERSTEVHSDICQGDIVTFGSEVPVIGPDGDPLLVDHPERLWMVVGNTCDFARDVDSVQWTQMVPIAALGPLADLSASERASATRYTYTRRFYLPPWSQAVEDQLHVAELLQPVAVDKRAVLQHATLDARMSHTAWMLLNACLVRFLARDDGRYHVP